MYTTPVNPVVIPIYKLTPTMLKAIFGPDEVAHVKHGKWIKYNNVEYSLPKDLLTEYTMRKLLKRAV